VYRDKVSRDPLFAAKVTDLVGLYLNLSTRPKNAIVLSLTRRRRSQALERTQCLQIAGARTLLDARSCNLGKASTPPP
jgi:hypothetical protein